MLRHSFHLTEIVVRSEVVPIQFTSLRIQTAMVSHYVNAKNEPDLFQEQATVKTKAGKDVSINFVFQDTLPSGSDIGTVVAVHGAPGSHKDFKYITPLLAKKGVRVIGVNWPGMDDQNLHDDNEERVQLVQQLVDSLKLGPKKVFMAHSRGSENALKMAALNKVADSVILYVVQDNCTGAVLINPIALHPHRVYNNMGLRTPDGNCAGVSLHLMRHADFDGQRKYIDMVNQSNVKTLIAFAGHDFLIQTSLSRDFTSHFKDNRELVCSTKDPDPEVEQQMKKAFHEGQQHLSVLFEHDGHFVQKTRAEFLASATLAILSDAQNNN